MNRRRVISLVIGAPLLSGAHGLGLREPQVVRILNRVLLRGFGGIWGLVIGEVVLGAMRAFGIDIAGAVEDFIRGQRSPGELSVTP